MALTIAWEGIGVISNAEPADFSSWGITGSGGSSISQDDQIFYQGTTSVASAISSGKNGWVWFNTATTYDFTSGGNAFEQRIYIWFNCTTPKAMNTKATPGLAIRVGGSTSAYRTFTLAGNDDLNGYSGGWKCVVIDPTLTGSITDGTGYNANTINYIGIYYNGSTASRSNNVFVDTIAIGKGIRMTGTETTTGQGLKEAVDYCTTLASRAWGALQQREGIYYAYGGVWIGGNSGFTTTFGTSGRVLKWGDSEYWSGSAWVTGIGDGTNKLTIADHASYQTYFTDGVLVGSAAGRSGNVYIGSSNINTTFVLGGGLHADSTTYFYGTRMQDITNGISLVNDAQHRFYSVTVQGSGQFNPVGAPIIRNCLFVGTASSLGCLLWNENINISNCTFIANTTGAAIQMPSAAGTPYAYNALFFSGNTYDVNNTATALTVNKNQLSDPTSYTGSLVTFAGTSVTTQVTVTDIDTGDVISGARVLVLVSNGVNFPYQASVDIIGSGTTATVTHTSHGLITNDNVLIAGAVEEVYNGCYSITYISSDSYSYTTAETIGSSPATGTITATLALINTDTNGSGIASDTRSMGNNQPITGRVRLATGSYYKQSPISDTVDKNNGKSINIQLIPDI